MVDTFMVPTVWNYCGNLTVSLRFGLQQKIIELKVKEYSEVAQHVQTEMGKLVWSVSQCHSNRQNIQSYLSNINSF